MSSSPVDDIQAAQALADYEAVDVLWVALVKLANRLKGPNEHKRMLALLDTVSGADLCAVLWAPGVDVLMQLDPPLETILADPHERLSLKQTADSLQVIKDQRENNPKEATFALCHVLKRIRNKRAHGFKSRGRRRDKEILWAARSILQSLCDLCT